MVYVNVCIAFSAQHFVVQHFRNAAFYVQHCVCSIVLYSFLFYSIFCPAFSVQAFVVQFFCPPEHPNHTVFEETLKQMFCSFSFERYVPEFTIYMKRSADSHGHIHFHDLLHI